MTLPRIIILPKVLAHFRIAAAAATVPFSVRHRHFRNTATEEWPNVAIQYLGDDAGNAATGSDQGSADGTLGEEVWELGLALIAETEIPPEDDAGIQTGLEAASAMIEVLINSIFAEGEMAENFDGTVWDVRYDGSIDLDEENATPDRVRLAEKITLLYRVRSEAPTQLLIGE